VDLKEIIAQLREEHARVTQAILAIEAVADNQSGRGKIGAILKRPRGRPRGSRNKLKRTVVSKPSLPGSTQESSGTED
jgi:hypothetical protein